MSGDERESGERPRRSWREIDQMRDGTRRRDEHSRPLGKVAQARVRFATEAYLKDADKIFDDRAGGEEGERLAKTVRDAHGTPGLAEACRAYRAALGMPSNRSLLTLFLDSDDHELVLAGLDALSGAQRQAGLEVSAGLKSQLRVLAQGFDDAVAEAAEELLERL